MMSGLQRPSALQYLMQMATQGGREGKTMKAAAEVVAELQKKANTWRGEQLT